MISSKAAVFFLISTLCIKAVLSVRIVEQNHQEVTVKVGDEVNLICTAESPAKACTFRAPTGDPYAIFEGARYNGGRITKNGAREADCGIKISGVQDNDHGRWECSISAVNEAGDLSVGTGYINVTVAVAPRAVSLMIDEAPSTSSVLRLKLDESGPKKIDCVAEAARPRPNFKWYIGSTEIRSDITVSEINPTADGKADYIESLSYIADPNHNGQELRCVVEQMGYSPLQLEQEDNIAKLTLELLFKPQQNPKEVQEFYELREGESNDIRMMFRANPKPNEGQWNINGVSVAVGSESLDQKYKSSFVDEGDLPGEYSVTLTINNLEKDNVGHTNELVITNEEGSTTYKFILEIGAKPPSASAGGPIAGIVILVLVLIALVGFGVFAKIKGILCFAAKSGDELADEKAAFDDPEKCLVKSSPEKEKAPTVTPAAAAPPATTATTASEKKAATPDKKPETPKPEAPKQPEVAAPAKQEAPAKPETKEEPKPAAPPPPKVTTTAADAEEKKSNGAHTPI